MDTRSLSPRGTGSSFRNLIFLIVCTALFVLGIRYTNLLHHMESQQAFFDEKQFDLTEAMKENLLLENDRKGLKIIQERIRSDKDKCEADFKDFKSSREKQINELERSRKQTEESKQQCQNQKTSIEKQKNECTKSKDDLSKQLDEMTKAKAEADKIAEDLRKQEKVGPVPVEKAAAVAAPKEGEVEQPKPGDPQVKQ